MGYLDPVPGKCTYCGCVDAPHRRDADEAWASWCQGHGCGSCCGSPRPTTTQVTLDPFLWWSPGAMRIRYRPHQPSPTIGAPVGVA